MPSLLVITGRNDIPAPRKVTKWTDLEARLDRLGVTVAFGGNTFGHGPELGEHTPLGTVREAIDTADLVIIDGNNDVGTALWAMARRGIARLPLVVTQGYYSDILTPDMWPSDASDLLQRVSKAEYPDAIDRVLGTALAQHARPVLESAPLPVPIMPSTGAYRRFGTQDLVHDVELKDVSRSIDPGYDPYDMPAGRVASSEVGTIIRQAILLAITERDAPMLIEATKLAAESVTEGSPLVVRALHGSTKSAKWVLYYLAMYCPEEMLNVIPDGTLLNLWTASFRQTNPVAISAAKRRGGRLLEAMRTFPRAVEAEREVEGRVQEIQRDATDLSRPSASTLYYMHGMDDYDTNADAMALTSLGVIGTPDITQLDESLSAGLANPNYWIATGRVRGLAATVREVVGMVPNNTWVNRHVRNALGGAVELTPPRDATEMAEWEDLVRGARSKNLQKTLLGGIAKWPSHSGGMTDLLRQHMDDIETQRAYCPETKLRHLARRTLDPTRRALLAGEANEAQRVRENQEHERMGRFRNRQAVDIALRPQANL